MKFVKKMFSWKSKSKRKGITPVIAIVLLLMMTVAAAGMAYVWIMSLQKGIASDTEDDLRDLNAKKNTQLTIVSVYNDTANVAFVIKSEGSYTFTEADAEGISVYADGKILTLPGTCKSNIRGRGTTCTIPGTTTGVAFPNEPGIENAVELRVEPPFGTGDIHSCTVPKVSSSFTTC